jgi:hypothetical protein
MRLGAQLLHQPQAFAAVDVVQRLSGVQAQVLSAAGLALRARTKGLTAQQVDRARTRDRSIVLTWAMRGTLHLIAAADYSWLIPLVTQPHVANAHRRLKQEGVPAGQPEGAVRQIARMLKREGPLTRKEIAERLKRLGIHTAGQAIAHLVWLAAAEGLICYGPDRDGEHCFVRVDDWLGKSKPVERDRALANLAFRYLSAHAPAAPADLAFWSGIPMGDAQRAWKLIPVGVLEVETSRGRLWTLPYQNRQAPPGLVRLLPAFDEYLLGWKDRDVAVDPEHRTKVNRGGGWLHPVVLVDGQVVATWSTKQSSRMLRIDLAVFSTLTPEQKHGVEAEAEEIAAFLGVPVEVGS